MNRTLLMRWSAAALLAAVATFSGQASAAPETKEKRVATVGVRDLSGQPASHVPVTFGQVFKKGDVPTGQQVHCLVDNRWAQVDVKRHYDDGSLRFAVISAILKELPAHGSRALSLAVGPPRPGPQPRPIFPSEFLKTDFDAVVTFTFPDGTVRSASARRLLEQAGPQPKTWLSGDAATEWLLSGPPLDRDGKPDDDLRVQFHVRACAGCKRARVSVVVENCTDHWAGNIRYDTTVAVGGKQVFSSPAVDHRPLSRWRKVFWWGEDEPALHVVHDLAYMSAAGALPNYDRTLQLPAPSRERQQQGKMTGPDWHIMGKGSLTAYMPTTGGRLEIAPYPTWTVEYLLSADVQAKTLVLANGDLAGSWPIHVRAEKSGRTMSIDERPKFWLDDRGKDRPQWKPARHAPDPKQVKLDPDIAHLPSLAYVPYLVTGDYYCLEEAYFWANYCLLSTWPEPRPAAKGILAGQIRGDAWGLRNIADAAWIAPDGDPEAKYFEEKIRNNIAERTRQMYGPPEYNKIGAWGVRTVEDARIQNPASPNWMITAPWEEDYLLWSLHHLVELGYAEAARPRDFLLRLRVGMLTHAPDFDPMLATPYRLVVGERTADKKVVFYEEWQKLGQENARLSKPGLPNYGNSYAYSARAAVICGIDAGFPKAPEALKWLDDNLSNHRRVMGENPAWAIVPRRAIGPR